MNDPSKRFAGATQVAGPLDGPVQSSKHRHLAQALHGDLVSIGMPRVNLMLTGMDGVIRNVLETILMDLQTPIASWYPGEQLVLPPVSHSGTMIIHDVAALPLHDQLRLLEWSEQASGKIQIVSTAATPLMPMVRAGMFNDTLYYRLNTVLVEATS